MAKLTREDLVSGYYGARDDHPGRKGFKLVGKTQRGVFYPNPEGCTGVRFSDSRKGKKRYA